MSSEETYFNALTQNEQLDLTFQEGIYLCERNSQDYIIELYALHGYFVELWYGGFDKEEGCFIKVRSSNSIKVTDPYFNDELSFKILKQVNP